MKAVFILIDALGWTYLEDRPFAAEILPFRSEMRTVLGFSSGAIPCILSGELPQESGRWNLFYYAPHSSPFKWVRHLRFLPGRVLNSRIVRRMVRTIAQRRSKFAGYFQFYGVPLELLPYLDIGEKKDIYRPGGVPNSIFDELDRMGVRYKSYSYHEGRDSLLVELACSDMRQNAADFYFVYLAELDAALHECCSAADEVDAVMHRYEQFVRALFAASTKDGTKDLGFFVFSDHGMTPKRRGFDLIYTIDELQLKPIRDYIALYDSTMARFWFMNQNARRKIERALSAVNCGHILSNAEQRQLGIAFDDNRFGDVIFLLDPGVLIEPSFMGKRAPEGMHGFHPDDRYSSASFLANVPPECPPRSLTDVHTLMTEWATRLREESDVHA